MQIKWPFGKRFVAALGLLLFANVGRADTTLWRIGLENNSRSEFTAASSSLPPTTYAIPGDWNTRVTWPEWGGVSYGDWDHPMDMKSNVTYNLASVPSYGAKFLFKTINASLYVPELAVFSNGTLCGIIQMVGTSPFQHNSTSNPLFGDTYQVYIPKEFLQTGTNTLRLVKRLHPYGSSRAYLSFSYDFMRLDALDAPIPEAIHSRMVYLGCQGSASGNASKINADSVAHDLKLIKWLGYAYSGNPHRATFWRGDSYLRTHSNEYLRALRDLNMTVVMDYYGVLKESQLVNGDISAQAKTDISNFFASYGSLFRFYELSNEPCAPFSDESLAGMKKVAEYIRSIRPTLAPHAQVVAPGYAYGGNAGTPQNWDQSTTSRAELEALCEATNGHAYGDSYRGSVGGNFIETLRTYGNGKFTSGFPKPFINSEYGSPNYAQETQSDNVMIQPHAAIFDRIVRAHVAFADRSLYYNFFPNDVSDHGIFNGTPNDPTTWGVVANVNGETSKFNILRGHVLAYATHGAPLPFTYLNRAALDNKLVYFRPVDTSTLPALPGSGAKSDKILLSFVNFEATAQTMQVRVTMPISGTYIGERFGAETTYSAARTTVSLSASPTLDLTVNLGPRESVQYILSKPISLRVPENPAGTVAGLDYKLYEGTWANLPDFNALTPVESGTVSNFSLAPRNRDTNYGFVYSGYVDAPTDGLYTFFLDSSDGSKLLIGSTVVVNNDGSHSSQEREGSIGLKAGKHLLKVQFFQDTGTPSLAVRWSGPGITKTAIPDVRLFRPGVPAGLVAWWKMDETSGTQASDATGNGKHGTLVSGAWNPTGKINGSVSLSGSAARVTLPGDLINTLGTMQSFACWFKTSSSGVILGINDALYPSTPGSTNPMLYIGTDGKLHGQIWTGSANVTIVSANTVNNGAWHHAALVAAGNTQRMYLDGVSVGTLSGNVGFATNNRAQLGAGFLQGWPAGNNSWMFFSGQLDDARLYNRALPPDEVAALAAG